MGPTFKPLIPIFLIALVDILGMTMLIPLLPFYAKSFGASPFQVGLLFSAYAACSLLAGPPLGNLSDRFGRKPVLLGSQVGTFLGFVLLAYAPTLIIVFVARILDGITAGNIAVAQAYIADVTPPQHRGRAFGVLGIAFGLGFLVGPAATAFLAATLGNRAAVLTAAGLSLTSILATLVLLPSGGAKSSYSAQGRVSVFDFAAYAQYLTRPALAPLFQMFFAFLLSFSMFTGGFALFADKRLGFGTTEVSYMFVYIGLLGIFVQGGMASKLSGRVSDRTLLLIGFIAAVAGQLMVGFAYNVPFLYLSATVGALNGLLRPVLTGLISRSCAPEEQGVAIGISQSLGSIAAILGPLIAGFLIQHELLTTWAATTSGIAAVGLVVLFIRFQPIPESRA